MANKVRCSSCKNYLDRTQLYRTGLGGLGGICSEACYTIYLDKYRDKRKRRAIHRERKYGGRRLPGACRDRVRRRDQGRCRWCGTSEDLNIHHVRYRSEGGPDTPKNLITLCFSCHKKAHSNKKKYQPIMLLWLWLFYVQDTEVTVEGAFRYGAKHPDAIDDARVFSNEVMQTNKEAKEEAA